MAVQQQKHSDDDDGLRMRRLMPEQEQAAGQFKAFLLRQSFPVTGGIGQLMRL